MASNKAYDEATDFISQGNSPRDINEFTPSPQTKTRAWELIERLKEGPLTTEETVELDDYVQLEHIMRLAKAQASQSVSTPQDLAEARMSHYLADLEDYEEKLARGEIKW